MCHIVQGVLVYFFESLFSLVVLSAVFFFNFLSCDFAAYNFVSDIMPEFSSHLFQSF